MNPVAGASHPIHPPLTDVTISAYAFATLAAVLSKLALADHDAIAFGHDDDVAGSIGAGALILILVGFAFLTAGGALGRCLVYTYGTRVRNPVEAPAKRSVA
jgi:hypothetical protein